MSIWIDKMNFEGKPGLFVLFRKLLLGLWNQNKVAANYSFSKQRINQRPDNVVVSHSRYFNKSNVMRDYNVFVLTLGPIMFQIYSFCVFSCSFKQHLNLVITKHFIPIGSDLMFAVFVTTSIWIYTYIWIDKGNVSNEYVLRGNDTAFEGGSKSATTTDAPVLAQKTRHGKHGHTDILQRSIAGCEGVSVINLQTSNNLGKA